CVCSLTDMRQLDVSLHTKCVCVCVCSRTDMRQLDVSLHTKCVCVRVQTCINWTCCCT
ncbi:hypothetical protein LSAT2_012900, partial [Lamellibrachia satsuma]